MKEMSLWKRVLSDKPIIRHDPKMLTENANGIFYRFCDCDNCCKERGWTSGNLESEIRDIFKCLFAVLVFCGLTALVAIENGTANWAFNHVVNMLGVSLGFGFFFMLFVAIIRILDNDEYIYSYKKNIRHLRKKLIQKQ